MVEHPTDGVAVVLASGDLDRSTAPRLGRVLELQLERCGVAAGRTARAGARSGPACVIVDLAGIGWFGEGGMGVLQRLRDAGPHADVALYLTGLAARTGLLPERVAEVVGFFDRFPTVETALAHLLWSSLRSDLGAGGAPRPPLRRSPRGLSERSRRAAAPRGCSVAGAASADGLNKPSARN